jgi:hypothetical protein
MSFRRYVFPTLLVGFLAAGAAIGMWTFAMGNDYTVRADKVELVAKITGPDSINRTDDQYQVVGTDLGIIWEAGPGKVMIAFGDTYGQGWGGNGAGPREADWRSNVLAVSSDTNLADGIHFDTMIQDTPGHAKEILPSRKINHLEETVIPTAGIMVGKRHYIHYMSVSNWGPPGVWFTNYAGIAYSDDDGQTWTKDPDARWPNNATWTHPFQMAAYARDGGYVYMYGTPNGRKGALHLARVPEADVLAKDHYQYWDGSQWQADEAAAQAIVPGPIGELSVQYNRYLQRWIMVYLDVDRYLIMLRDAPRPTGPWSDAKELVRGTEYAALYGGYIHPWSNNGPDLYFTMSQWEPYNVFLMRSSLRKAVVSTPTPAR